MGIATRSFQNLCSKLTSLAGRAAGYSLGGAAGAFGAGLVIDALVEAISAESHAAAAEEKLNRLIGMHYLVGQRWLAEAKVQTRATVKEQYIERALESFVNASEVELPLQASRADAYVGSCHGLLGRPDLHNFEQAFSRCELIEKNLAAENYQLAGVDMARISCNPSLSVLSRRSALSLMMSGLKLNSYFSNESLLVRFQELYQQMDGLNSLLKRRGSLIKLRADNDFSDNSIGEAIYSWLENDYCHLKPNERLK